MRRLIVLILVAILTTAVGGRAHAFVRTLNAKMGVPVYWQTPCVPATIYLNNFLTKPANAGMSLEAVVKSVTAAAHTWSPDAVISRATELGATSCQAGGGPVLEIVPTVAPEATKPPLAAKDGRNSIIFRTDDWSKSGEGLIPYAAEGLAVTTVTSEPDGHIVDVDIEINAASASDFQWINLDPGVVVPNTGNGDSHTAQLFDLQDALTHEFGHFIGLAHTCFSPAQGSETVDAFGLARPLDDKGNPIPDCGAEETPAAISSSVMYYTVDNFLDTSKRVLSLDDVNAVCTIYPQSNFHEACLLDQANPGCAVATPTRARWGRGAGTGLGVVAAVVAVAARRRRRLSARARARA